MNTSYDDMIELVYRSLTESLDSSETETLNAWLNADSSRREWYRQLAQTDLLSVKLREQAPDRVDTLLRDIYSRVQKDTGISVPFEQFISSSSSHPVRRIHFLKKWGWAAAVLLLLGAGAYLYTTSRKTSTREEVVKAAPAEILPGTNKAVLTVDNKQIDLAANKSGIIAGNTIIYSDGEPISAAGQLLTLSTPKGGQYQAVLPDGSRVWLNAASSIRFPSKFTGTARQIEVTGEVYMEVAQNKGKSFIVEASGATVQVLGTSFNINAYADEGEIKVTLLTGTVKVSKGGSDVILKPGQQAIIKENINIDRHADLEQVISWKNGAFQFSNADVPTVLRQLARWYDIEVIYPKGIPSNKINGKMGRNLNLQDVLSILKAFGLNVELEGRKLFIVAA